MNSYSVTRQVGLLGSVVMGVGNEAQCLDVAQAMADRTGEVFHVIGPCGDRIHTFDGDARRDWIDDSLPQGIITADEL